MTDATPSTIIDIESLTRDMIPMAKSQPKAMETAIHAISWNLLYERASRMPMSSRAMEIARMLSRLICLALVTAMRGAPTALTSTSGYSSLTFSAAVSTSSATFEFIPDSLIPKGEVKKARPCPSRVNIQSSTIS